MYNYNVNVIIYICIEIFVRLLIKHVYVLNCLRASNYSNLM